MGVHVQEVETAVREDLPVCFVVLCDRQWGMVKLTQQVGLGPLREVLGVDAEGTINADLGEVRYDEMAWAMGAMASASPRPTTSSRRYSGRWARDGRPSFTWTSTRPSTCCTGPPRLQGDAPGASGVSRPSVLVTGAAGYVGTLSLDALAARRDELEHLVALDVQEVREARRHPDVAYVVADARTADLAGLLREHEVDTVVHLASILRVPPGAPEDLAYRVDVVGARNVLEACVSTRVGKLVVTSSGAAYGYHADNPSWLDEGDLMRGNEGIPYAHHKRLAEAMLAEHRRDHPEIAQLVLRAGTIAGEGTSSPVTDLFEGPAVLGVRGPDSPFVFIWDHDLVEVVLLGVLGRRRGVYNLAGDGVLAPVRSPDASTSRTCPCRRPCSGECCWCSTRWDVRPTAPTTSTSCGTGPCCRTSG
jgi:UDP-glucose 4-epimerase